MGLLDNLYHRTTLPGDLTSRRRAGVVQEPGELLAAYGSRVQIPRVWRRRPPYGLDYEDGHDDRRGHSVVIHPPPLGSPPPSAGTPPPSSQPPGVVPAAPGYRRVFNFNYTADTSGSDPSFEIRLTPPIGFPFRVTELTITPLAAVTVGQYLDILVLPNADMADAGAFLGSSLFENLALMSDIPTPDGNHAIAVPVTTLRLENLGPVFAAGQQVKGVVFFVAPAISMPQMAVTLVVEELSPFTQLPPARQPPDQPPLTDPPTQPPQIEPPAVRDPVVFLTTTPSYSTHFSTDKPFYAYRESGTWYVTAIVVGDISQQPSGPSSFSYPPPSFDWPARFYQALDANLVNIVG